MTTVPTFRTVHTGPYAGDSRLAGWRENVGAPVAADCSTASGWPAGQRQLTILSWNLWIGRGRLAEVVTRIREGAYADRGIAAEAPLVVLAQEAYRADASIPPRSNGWAPREITARERPREEIVDLAHRLGLNLRYAPSMRNGAEQSDRGAAVLASVPLHDAVAYEAPLVLQRRVAVGATLDCGANRQVRLLSVHLDPRGPPGYRWLGAAGRAFHVTHLLPVIPDDTAIAGADLNLGRGRREQTWRLLTEAGFTPGVPAALPAWRHTYHALPRLVLDYILFRNRRGVFASATVHRLDEDPRDRGPTVFGSDHHPLLASIELT